MEYFNYNNGVGYAYIYNRYLKTYEWLIYRKDVKCQEFIINRINHHTQKPAFVWMNNGKVERESYYIHGKLHNTRGPAEIIYCNDKINYEIYYINHVQQKIVSYT